MKKENKKPENPLAFPCASGASSDGYLQEGMTLRDHFAGIAMRENMARGHTGNDGHVASAEYDIIASYSYQMADAMLKQREK